MVTYNTSEGELVESLDEDGEIEKSSDGGRTTDVGGCISDRE